jgi:hypothetical protein
MAGKPPLAAYLPLGVPFRYLSGNAVKVHLWLLSQPWASPPVGPESEWTFYGETAIAEICQAVRLKESSVYRVLDELVAFGLLRRDRLRSEGTVIGLAYWLKPAPRLLTRAAIQRIKERLLNKELRTEEAKRELAQDGIVFDAAAERKDEIKGIQRA